MFENIIVGIGVIFSLVVSIGKIVVELLIWFRMI